jgi:hypothetical protein
VPRKEGGKRVGAGLGRAEGRNAFGRRERERRLGLWREKRDDRLCFSALHDRFNGKLRMKLRRGADHREHRIAVRLRGFFQCFAIALRGRGHG